MSLPDHDTGCHPTSWCDPKHWRHDFVDGHGVDTGAATSLNVNLWEDLFLAERYRSYRYAPSERPADHVPLADHHVLVTEAGYDGDDFLVAIRFELDASDEAAGVETLLSYMEFQPEQARRLAQGLLRAVQLIESVTTASQQAREQIRAAIAAEPPHQPTDSGSPRVTAGPAQATDTHWTCPPWCTSEGHERVTPRTPGDAHDNGPLHTMTLGEVGTRTVGLLAIPDPTATVEVDLGGWPMPAGEARMLGEYMVAAADLAERSNAELYARARLIQMQTAAEG